MVRCGKFRRGRNDPRPPLPLLPGPFRPHSVRRSHVRPMCGEGDGTYATTQRLILTVRTIPSADRMDTAIRYCVPATPPWIC